MYFGKKVHYMRRTYLPLTEEERTYLQSIKKKRTMEARVVEHAKILLYKADGLSFDAISEKLDVNKNTVRLCISKYNAGGLDAALFNEKRSGRPVEISDDAKAWIINIACQRPVDLGYPQELWTLTNLQKHINQYAEEAGFPRLGTVTKSYIQKFLKEQDIKPFKIKYYCEKRDPDFEDKMHKVLLIYKQVEMQFDEAGKLIVPDNWVMTHTISYDEKPGIQAIANTSPDLRPNTENGEIYRDHEYKRLGTISLLASIDLNTGKAIPLVSNSHKSSDFIGFLKILDREYPEQDTIRIILDNHSAHKSKETKSFLATMPEHRFEFVFTPTHGSWLNLIESFFSKMTKQMLRGIRVESKQELIERIYEYFEEINKDPIIYHWKYKMNEISEGEINTLT